MYRKWMKQLRERGWEGAGETAMLRKAVSYEAFKGWTQWKENEHSFPSGLGPGWLPQGWMWFIPGVTCLTGTLLGDSTSLSVPWLPISEYTSHVGQSSPKPWMAKAEYSPKFGCSSVKYEKFMLDMERWQLSTCNGKNFFPYRHGEYSSRNQKWDKQRDRWAITGGTKERVRTLIWLNSAERWDQNCIWESECDKRVPVPEKRIWFYLVDRRGQCRQLITIALMLCWWIFATYFEGRRDGWGESVNRLLQLSRKKR